MNAETREAATPGRRTERDLDRRRAPKDALTIQVWESVDKIKARRNSRELKEIRKIGDKYAKLRAFSVEGLPQ